MPIKVRATNPGFYGQYREKDHEFEIQDEKHFSKKWMEKVEKSKGKKAKAEESEDAPEADTSEDVI